MLCIVEMDEEEERSTAIANHFASNPFPPDDIAVDQHPHHPPQNPSRYSHSHQRPPIHHTESSFKQQSVAAETPRQMLGEDDVVYNPPRHPTSIFSFPTPTTYSAPPNPTANLAPCANGSASELFKCVVKKPDVVQMEINGEMQSNAFDVTVQFLAELRVYTTVTRHRNICAFLGSLENVGMVLEYIDGRTLYDMIATRPKLGLQQKVDLHNQLLDGLAHLHSYGLSHGDLSLLNVQVTHSSDTVKLHDFGRSVSATSTYVSFDDGIGDENQPMDPFSFLGSKESLLSMTRTEQIHPGTRPFCAPEILRGECTDVLLADAYSFGMILVCLDRCESVDVKPWDQRKDLLPKDLFENCEVFEDRARSYLKKWTDGRRRLVREDILALPRL